MNEKEKPIIIINSASLYSHSTWLPLVSPIVTCWDVISSISRVSKSPTFRSPLLASSLLKFSANQSFSSLLPLSLMHFHTYSSLLLTPELLCQLPFLSFLSLKHFVSQTLTSSASLTALQRFLCILQRYCHDHLFSLLHIECWIPTERSCDKLL